MYKVLLGVVKYVGLSQEFRVWYIHVGFAGISGSNGRGKWWFAAPARLSTRRCTSAAPPAVRACRPTRSHASLLEVRRYSLRLLPAAYRVDDDSCQEPLAPIAATAAVHKEPSAASRAWPRALGEFVCYGYLTRSGSKLKVCVFWSSQHPKPKLIRFRRGLHAIWE
jgi:hypothetical protein